MIRDVSLLLDGPMQSAAQRLYDEWDAHWCDLGSDAGGAEEILAAVGALRAATRDSIQGLQKLASSYARIAPRVHTGAFIMTKFFGAAALSGLLLLAACGGAEPPPGDEVDSAAERLVETEATVDEGSEPSSLLDTILESQPEEFQARYPYRHPKETLEFFGIEPGMTVLEGLPGGGWYTKLLLDYLGPEGTLLVANYDLDLYPLFSFASEEMLERQANWATNWPETVAEWGISDAAKTDAFNFGAVPEALHGSVDVVFFPRVLHNMANFQNAGEGEFLSEAFADVYALLKPGGTFGVVQHQAPEDKSDEWASGNRGYLKKSFVIAQAEAVGFELVSESAINENPKDQPGDDDIVWRLPPSLTTSREDEELRAEMQAIGESNRMTLKFRKPDDA